MKAFIRIQSDTIFDSISNDTENQVVVTKATLIRRKDFPVKITMYSHPDNTLDVVETEKATTDHDHDIFTIHSDDNSDYGISDVHTDEDDMFEQNASSPENFRKYFDRHSDISDEQRKRSRSDAAQLLQRDKQTHKKVHLLRPKSDLIYDKSDKSDCDDENDVLSSSFNETLSKHFKRHRPPSSPKRKKGDRMWRRSSKSSRTAENESRPHSMGPVYSGRKTKMLLRQLSMPSSEEKSWLTLPDLKDRKQSLGSIKHAMNAINEVLRSPKLKRKSLHDGVRSDSFDNDYIESIDRELEELRVHQPDAYYKFKIIQVQERFPHDKLDLDVTLEEHEKLKYKRHHSPNMRHKKGSFPVDIEIEHRKLFDENDKSGRSSPTALARRIYIQEGAVKLSSANSTNERYFFLFNDLLLVAKPKSASTFKLKERVKVSEIWLAQCIDEVTDVSVVHERAFVIGWPTTNYVAAFNSTEEKDLWFNALQKSINERRENEDTKEIPIKICNRVNADDSYTPQMATLSVTSKHDAREVIKMSLEHFQYQNEEPTDYQLWLSTKDIGLIGHESPYSIKMNHCRTYPDITHDENENQFDTATITQDAKFHFVLKKTKKDIGNSQKKWKNPIKKSPIINWAMNKKTIKAPYSQMEALPPGKLFGNPLTQLSTEDDVVPKPIQDILLQLFRRGPATTGIFRKSANQRTVKQIRLMLDQGKEVDFEEKSAIVLATVIKDFCRSLPDSLIISDLYDDLVSSKATEDSSARVDQMKRILSQLPKEHYEVTMRFMCALYHIQRFSERNNMNSYNLSICVSPSVMWPPVHSKLSVTEQAAGSSDVICFLIDNFVAIFSEENEYLLGLESDIQLDEGPGEDSDSGTDQFIYKCRQSSDDNDGEAIRSDFEKENEPPTPDFVFTPDENSMNSAFTHSDSSLGTNDSDETKSAVILNVPSITLAPEKTTGSRSSPSSPTTSRKREIMLIDKSKIIDAKAYSDISDHEGSDSNEQFQRKLLRHPRNKRVLSSSTTSAELIEHKRHITESPPSPKPNEKRKQFSELSQKTTENVNVSTSPTSNAAPQKIARKSVISQPMIQHFATEYYATPNVIFHSVDRRRQPAAPSYEEHIQRTQSKHRIVQSTTVKKPLIAQATLIQKQDVDEYQPLQNFVNTLDAQEVQRVRRVVPMKELRRCVTVNSDLNSKTAPKTNKIERGGKFVNGLPRAKSSHEIQRANIDSTFNSIFETINKNMPITKTNTVSGTGSASSMSSVSSNVTSSSLETSPPRNTVTNSSKAVESIETSPAERDRNKFPKLELNCKSDHDFSVSSGNIESDINSSVDSTCSVPTENPINNEIKLSPQSVNNPFSLNFKTDNKKNSLKSDGQTKSHSIQFQKTSLTLTKAPLKLDELRVNNLPSVEPGRVITARELRKTNRRLKSEIRNAFNDGFGYKQGKDILSETMEQPRRNKMFAMNGHLSRPDLREMKSRQALKFLERQSEEEHSERTAELLEISKHRYTENNNNLTDDKDIFKKIWAHNESYV